MSNTRREPGSSRRSALLSSVADSTAALNKRIKIGEDLLRQIQDARATLAFWGEDRAAARRFRNQIKAWRIGNQAWLDSYLGGEVADEYRTFSKHRDIRTIARAAAGTVVNKEQLDLLWGVLAQENGMLESICTRLPMWVEDGSGRGESLVAEPNRKQAETGNSPVFIVHGNDTLRAESVARTVENATLRSAIILREMPNQGRTLIEKFEQHANAASYAIVLLTADDEGGKRGAEERSLRGRQNVVFELGYFFGRLGRERVSVLLDPGVEKPSDVDGIAYIPFDDDGEWNSALLREMHHAGFQVDFLPPET